MDYVTEHAGIEGGEIRVNRTRGIQTVPPSSLVPGSECTAPLCVHGSGVALAHMHL